MQTQRFKVNSLTYYLLPVCLMLAICFLLFFRGIGETEFYDKQEAREALVIWEIHNSGNWVLPLRNEEEIPAKPPFYHWLLGDFSLWKAKEIGRTRSSSILPFGL
jgi:4-amino-4-deoxy-L-arabinose transferase-like glycosyltransferase